MSHIEGLAAPRDVVAHAPAKRPPIAAPTMGGIQGGVAATPATAAGAREHGRGLHGVGVVTYIKILGKCSVELPVTAQAVASMCDEANTSAAGCEYRRIIRAAEGSCSTSSDAFGSTCTCQVNISQM